MGNSKLGRAAVQTAALMSILILVSKVIGFVREMVMANYFGTSFIVDAYVMASNILTVLFGGLLAAIATTYMPVFSEITENGGEMAGQRFTSQVVNLLLLITVGISIIGIMFSDQIIGFLVRGFDGETARLASFYVKIIFSYVIFSSVSGILDTYLQYRGTFLPQIISGYFFSICVIASIIISAHTSYYYLAFGYVAGYACKAVVGYGIARGKGYRHSGALKFTEKSKRLFVLALPVFVGGSIQNINFYVDKTLASGLEVGSISALNYASLLSMTIIGLTTSILATLIYPKLTQANTLKQYDRFESLASQGIYAAIIIALPFSLGAMLYSEQVIQIVYERGEFNAASTQMTSYAFFYYAMGMLFFAVNELLVRMYYARGDMKNPMFFGIVSVIINVVLDFVLVYFMGIRGLALATSLSALTSTVMFSYGLKRGRNEGNPKLSIAKLLRIGMASIIAVGCSYGVYWIMQGLTPVRFLHLAAAVAAAILIYLGLLFALRIEEVHLMKQIFKRS